MTRLLVCFLLGTIMRTFGQEAVSEPVAQEIIYRMSQVDNKPNVLDSEGSLSVYFGQRLKLPDLRNRKIKIFLSFVVQKDGSISDRKITSISVNPIQPEIKLTEEQELNEKKFLKQLRQDVLEILNEYKKPWSPAIKDGNPVSCIFNYPLNLLFE